MPGVSLLWKRPFAALRKRDQLNRGSLCMGSCPEKSGQKWHQGAETDPVPRAFPDVDLSVTGVCDLLELGGLFAAFCSQGF